jgi:endoglucanase
MNVIRLPFLWERIQRSLNAPLDTTELGRLDATVNYITVTKNIYVLLDVHNYALYNKVFIGTAAVPIDAFANLWTQYV